MVNKDEPQQCVVRSQEQSVLNPWFALSSSSIPVILWLYQRSNRDHGEQAEGKNKAMVEAGKGDWTGTWKGRRAYFAAHQLKRLAAPIEGILLLNVSVLFDNQDCKTSKEVGKTPMQPLSSNRRAQLDKQVTSTLPNPKAGDRSPSPDNQAVTPRGKRSQSKKCVLQP